MELDQASDIHVTHAVSVGAAKIVLSKIAPDPFDSSASHRALARIEQSDAPWLGTVLVDLHLSVSILKPIILSMTPVAPFPVFLIFRGMIEDRFSFLSSFFQGSKCFPKAESLRSDELIRRCPDHVSWIQP